MIEFVLSDFAAQRVAMDSEHFGGAALVALRAFQGPADEAFFEFADGLLKKNSALHHLSD